MIHGRVWSKVWNVGMNRGLERKVTPPLIHTKKCCLIAKYCPWEKLRQRTRHHATSRDTLHQLQHTCAQVKVGGAGYLQKFLETLVVHLPMPVMAQSLIADPAGDLVI